MSEEHEDHSHDKITLSRWQIEKEIEHGIFKKQIENHEKLIPEIFAAIKATNVSMNSIPMEIMRCREDMERDIKAYMHNGFITDKDLLQFENKLEDRMRVEMRSVTDLMNRVMAKVSQGTWIITGAVLAGAAIVWVLTQTNVVLT